MKNTVYDVVVIGAGVAGLSASYYLQQHGLNHVVFDRGRVGEAWRTQRWDSFRLNSINKLNMLAGAKYSGIDANGFDSATEYISSFEDYVSRFHLPVLENCKVVLVD